MFPKGGMKGLMKQAQQMQKKMKEMEDELKNLRIKVSASGKLVEIEANGKKTSTNPQGWYVIYDIIGKEVEITFSVEGYGSVTVWMNIRSDGTNILDIELLENNQVVFAGAVKTPDMVLHAVGLLVESAQEIGASSAQHNAEGAHGQLALGSGDEVAFEVGQGFLHGSPQDGGLRGLTQAETLDGQRRGRTKSWVK